MEPVTPVLVERYLQWVRESLLKKPNSEAEIFVERSGGNLVVKITVKQPE